jgi:hypothetical protein
LQSGYNVDFSDPLALFCLHYLFLDKINISLKKFKDSWNVHKMRTECYKSPVQLDFMYQSISQAVPYTAAMEGLEEQPDWNDIEGHSVQVDPVYCPLSEDSFSIFQLHYQPYTEAENNAFYLSSCFVNAFHFCHYLFSIAN